MTAAASAHAYAQSIWHIEEEIKAASGVMEPLYETLTREGPYAYMVIPEVQPDGTVKLPRITRREEIISRHRVSVNDGSLQPVRIADEECLGLGVTTFGHMIDTCLQRCIQQAARPLAALGKTP